MVLNLHQDDLKLVSQKDFFFQKKKNMLIICTSVHMVDIVCVLIQTTMPLVLASSSQGHV